MKWSVTILCIISVCFTSYVHAAKRMYVTGEVKITLRRAAGLERKILGFVNTGAEIVVLSPGRDWSKVRVTEDGRVGWILSRFLSHRPPCTFHELNLLEDASAKLSSRVLMLKREKRVLEEGNLKLQTKLTRAVDNLERLKRAGVRKRQKNKGTVRTALPKGSGSAGRINGLWDTGLENIPWFLTGAGVFAIGLLMGFLMGRTGNRSGDNHKWVESLRRM